MSAEFTRSAPIGATPYRVPAHDDTIRDVLPNGLTLLVRRDESAPVVAIVTHVKAGYFDETDDIVGISHVLEHMFFKGTPTRGVGAIARETKANGGFLNAHTIYDHTTYYAVLPSDAFLQGLEIQFDAYARSVIDADELTRELEVIIQEAHRKRDSPSAVTIESLYALLHDQHRIRRWRIGEESVLRSFTAARVRDFYRTWYVPSNTIVSIVGNVDPDVVRREVAARHGALAAGAIPSARGPREERAPGFRQREWTGDVVQQQIALGWRAPELSHADAPALELASVALGTGRASRLYRTIREHRLATSVSAWHYTARDAGVFVVNAESPPEHAAKATARMWQEVERARVDGFRDEEIVRAQRVLEARWLRRLETMDGQATYLASWEAQGGLAVGATYADRLMSLDVAAVQGAMKRHLDVSQLSVVSYRPQSALPIADSAESMQLLLRTPARESLYEAPLSQGVLRATLSQHQEALNGSHDATRRTATMQPVRTVTASGVHTITLSNGVTALVLPRRGAPMVSIGVYQRGGSSEEQDGRDGLARLTAHAMLKGTHARSGVRIAEESEAMGSSIGVSVGVESVGWGMSVPPRDLAHAIELLADVTQHPLFADESIETERALALAEITRLHDDMQRWPMRLASMGAYGAHFYARGVLGTHESMALLHAADVHTFHAQHILRGESVVVVVGDISVDETSEQLARAFTTLQYREQPVSHAVPPWPSASQQLSEQRDKQQTAMTLMFPGPSRTDPARFSARVFSAIASGLGGRFFEQLRDKQSLAYTVSAFPVERRWSGAIAAYIATSPLREDEAREGLLLEFAKFRESAPSEDEVGRARRYLIGTHAIGLQTASAVMSELVDAWMFGDALHAPDVTSAHIAAVTPSDILTLAQRYFDPSRVMEGVVRGRA